MNIIRYKCPECNSNNLLENYSYDGINNFFDKNIHLKCNCGFSALVQNLRPIQIKIKEWIYNPNNVVASFDKHLEMAYKTYNMLIFI